MKNLLYALTFATILSSPAEAQEKVRRPIIPQVSYQQVYPDFKYQKEIPIIINTARRVGVEPELLLAIRAAEGGSRDHEFGIVHTSRYRQDHGVTENGEFREYKSGEKQASWAAWTVKNSLQRFGQQKREKDFLRFLKQTYAPAGIPQNQYWLPNVREYYNRFKKK